MVIEYAPIIINGITAAFAAMTTIKGYQFNKEASNLRKENDSLTKKIRELAEDKEDPLTYDGGVYVNVKGDMFCPNCYDGEHKKRMHLGKKNGDADNDYYSCPRCKTSYHKKLPPEEREKTFKWLFGR
jgi:hypothetical protein